ncbi:MAG: exo-alpha-sialidase [Myxococcales bacterium]|nr:exo-alpha-sialidase [Myxococcales bacterium]
MICTIAPARANGRFPEAQLIESVPGDPSTVFLRATFGVLVSRDAGKTWRWICERALGYDGQWDPPVTATRDGRLWVGLEDGLVSTRDGCELEPASELDGQTVKDLTTDPRGETIWAITGAPGKTSYVWRRSPGKRFERLAGMDDTNLMTIEVAPSNPSRVYLSGQPYSTIRGQTFRSNDGGATFTTEKNDLEAEGPFFIGAVDPRDPNRLLIRHLHGKGSDLLLTRDGGKTFKNVLTMTSAMFGFAKSRDGSTYWAGSGLADHGLFRSTDRGEHFESVSKNGVLCLHSAAPDALFVCENALSVGAPAIAVSRDRGATITPLARFADIEGPVACATPDARASLCSGSWPEMKSLLAPVAPVLDAGLAGAGDDDGAQRSHRQRHRDGGAGDGGAGGAEPSPARRSTCGCEVVGQPVAGPDLRWLIAGGLALILRFRSSILHGSRLTQRRER